MNKVKINEISVKVSSGLTPYRLNANYWENGTIDWVKTEQIGERFIFNSNEKINKKALEETSIKLNPINTLSIAMYGEGRTRGSVSILKKEMTTNQACCNIILDNKKADVNFIYYKLKTQYLNLRLLSSGVRKNLNSNDIKDFEITIPNLPTQQKIAAVLSALDDKIELNNKINIELEEMAKTLYDYWFVQFDFPFDFAQGKPNEEGKPYKSSGGEMVYDAVLKREIPKGWEVKKLEEVESNIITGKTPSTLVESNFGGDIPFVTIDDIRKQLYIFKSDRTLTELGASTQSSKFLNDGDICVSCIGTVGVIGFVGKRCQTNQQINSISKIKDYNRYFLLNALRMYFEFNTGAKQGAVLSNMNKGEFSEILIVDPSLELKKKYLEKVKPLYQKIKINLQQNQELASLRDWLLPMLMNGQVRVGGSDGEGLGLVAEERGEYN